MNKYKYYIEILIQNQLSSLIIGSNKILNKNDIEIYLTNKYETKVIITTFTKCENTINKNNIYEIEQMLIKE